MEVRVPFMGSCLLSGQSILFLLGEDPLRGTSPTASGLKLLDTVGGFQLLHVVHQGSSKQSHA